MERGVVLKMEKFVSDPSSATYYLDAFKETTKTLRLSFFSYNIGIIFVLEVQDSRVERKN